MRHDFYSSGDFNLCGGSILNKNLVLTAGHCVTDAMWILVYLGVHEISEASEARLVDDKGIFLHPQYDFPNHDIALVRTRTTLLPQDLIDRVGTTCLTTDVDPEVFDKLLAIGWGKTSDSASSSNVLKQVVYIHRNLH